MEDVVQKKKIRLTPKPIKLTKRQWTTEEKEAVFRHLGKFILLKALPGKKSIDDCISAEPILKNRSWRIVKDYCRNRITALKRK